MRDSGIIATPARSRARGPPDSASPAASSTVPAVGALGAEDRARELGAPGADEPGEADDLARAHGEAHAVHARRVQVADGEDRRRVVGRRRAWAGRRRSAGGRASPG